MDKITHQVRAEHWARILNECLNSGMSKTAWCRANVNHFFTLLGKMFFTPYGKEFFSYSGKQIFTS